MENVVIYDKLEDIASSVEYNGGGINELKNKGCVKSVQRGCTSFYQAEVNGPNAHITKNINISNVNVNKSILLLETNIIGQDVVNSNARGHKYAVTLNSTSIIFDFYYTVNNDVEFIVPLFFWQVVEFY